MKVEDFEVSAAVVLTCQHLLDVGGFAGGLADAQERSCAGFSGHHIAPT